MTTEVKQAVVEVLMSSRYVIGLDVLNSENMDEWLFRMQFARALDREAFKVRAIAIPSALRLDESFYISKDHLNSCIGLKLNVNPRTRKVWIRDLMKAVESRIGMDGGSEERGKKVPSSSVWYLLEAYRG